jgi:prepilin-type N-terminal cleavage/methylation domain-containing protein
VIVTVTIKSQRPDRRIKVYPRQGFLCTICPPDTSYDVNRMPSSLRRRREKGFSLIELLIVIAIILIILVIAIPQYNKARMNAQEMAAVAEIQNVNKMEIQYYSQFGNYATTLAQLGPPTQGGAEGPNAAGLLPANLTAGSSGGYNFTLTQSAGGYALSAVPKSFNSTGRRTFYTDQTDVVHQNWGQDPATANSPEMR